MKEVNQDTNNNTEGPDRNMGGSMAVANDPNLAPLDLSLATVGAHYSRTEMNPDSEISATVPPSDTALDISTAYPKPGKTPTHFWSEIDMISRATVTDTAVKGTDNDPELTTIQRDQYLPQFQSVNASTKFDAGKQHVFVWVCAISV